MAEHGNAGTPRVSFTSQGFLAFSADKMLFISRDMLQVFTGLRVETFLQGALPTTAASLSQGKSMVCWLGWGIVLVGFQTLPERKSE